MSLDYREVLRIKDVLEVAEQRRDAKVARLNKLKSAISSIDYQRNNFGPQVIGEFGETVPAAALISAPEKWDVFRASRLKELNELKARVLAEVEKVKSELRKEASRVFALKQILMGYYTEKEEQRLRDIRKMATDVD
ncbi:MAG: hypothetical protein ACPGNV_17300 [Mangrovicoccus sp.]